MKKKILIIRLSSLGDIIQCLPVVDQIQLQDTNCEIHWLVRSDLASCLNLHPFIKKIIAFDKNRGLFNFLKLCWDLRKENYTHVYDAHSNLRSHLATFTLNFRLVRRPFFIRRSKERWKRWLLFNLRINTFPKPYSAMHSYLKPLSAWKMWDTNSSLPLPNFKTLRLENNPIDPIIIAAPSAAWDLKKWPENYWSELIGSMKNKMFILVGGPNDDLCQRIHLQNPQNSKNMAGQLSWEETFKLISKSQLTLSADTGTLHMADYLGVPALAILGPTAFGHPSRNSTSTIEVNINCRPCTKDGNSKCQQKTYKACLVNITPSMVKNKISQSFNKLQI